MYKFIYTFFTSRDEENDWKSYIVKVKLEDTNIKWNKINKDEI